MYVQTRSLYHITKINPFEVINLSQIVMKSSQFTSLSPTSNIRYGYL